LAREGLRSHRAAAACPPAPAMQMFTGTVGPGPTTVSCRLLSRRTSPPSRPFLACAWGFGTALAALAIAGGALSPTFTATASNNFRRLAARRGNLLSPPPMTQLGATNIDGPYGVLEESAAPIIDTRTEDGKQDKLLKSLVTAVQAADRKRGIDLSAFWINDGWDISLIVTALSRPQLQAIAQEIHHDMRKVARMKRIRASARPGQTIRDEASTGWVCLLYDRISINIMTPVQRTYYDIEGAWRDDNQDYQKIPLDVMLREEGFANMRLTRELGGSEDEDDESEDDEDDFEEDFDSDGPDSTMDYEEDEDDPFWS